MVIGIAANQNRIVTLTRSSVANGGTTENAHTRSAVRNHVIFSFCHFFVFFELKLILFPYKAVFEILKTVSWKTEEEGSRIGPL